MDVFTPAGPRNGIAIVDVVSGAWYSERNKIEDHRRGRFFDIFCGRGYTVFRHSTGVADEIQRSRDGAESAQRHRLGARTRGRIRHRPGPPGPLRSFCRRAPRLPDAGDDRRGQRRKVDQPFRAAAIFFPPTDFSRGAECRSITQRTIRGMFATWQSPALNRLSKRSTRKNSTNRSRQISPGATRAVETASVFDHSRRLGSARAAAAVAGCLSTRSRRREASELIVKAGGGHPWPTINEEVQGDGRLARQTAQEADLRAAQGRGLRRRRRRRPRDGRVHADRAEEWDRIIDVASGAWHSDRGKIRDHMRAQVYDIFCGKGYTVFAVRPGSISRFSVPDMVAHLRTATKWVQDHAAEYGIDPQNLGITGGSAGGHLPACGRLDAGRTRTARSISRSKRSASSFRRPTSSTIAGQCRPTSARTNARRNGSVRWPARDHSREQPIDAAKLTELARKISPACWSIANSRRS